MSPRRYYIEQTPIPGSNTGLYSCDVPFVDAVLEMKAPGMETDPGSCTPSNVRIDGAGCTVESEYRCLELPYAGGLWLTNASYTCRDPGCEELVGVAVVQQFYGTETASQLRCSAEHEITLFEIFP